MCRLTDKLVPHIVFEALNSTLSQHKSFHKSKRETVGAGNPTPI